jgi:hypothetical protein
MEEKISTNNVEMCTIRSDTKIIKYKSASEIELIIA